MHFTYCPQCGNKLISKEIGDEGKIPFCSKCSRPFWDMFTTSVICAAVNEYNEIALIRQSYVSQTNYVCIAGIIQLGETAEQTVIREVKEETGLDADKLEYVRSYFYEKKSMLMLGYVASVKKADFKLSGEVDSAEWVPISDALDKLRSGSIAWELVREVQHIYIQEVKNMVVYGKEADINSWMELVKGVSRNFPGLETQEKIDEHRNTVLKFMKQNRGLCVKDDDKVVGVLLFSVKHNMICCLAVSPDYRRQGIASVLIAEALNNLDMTKDITVSTFRADDEKGTAPRALYKKFGFVEGELIEEFGYPNQKFILKAKEAN